MSDRAEAARALLPMSARCRLRGTTGRHSSSGRHDPASSPGRGDGDVTQPEQTDGTDGGPPLSVPLNSEGMQARGKAPPPSAGKRGRLPATRALLRHDNRKRPVACLGAGEAKKKRVGTDHGGPRDRHTPRLVRGERPSSRRRLAQGGISGFQRKPPSQHGRPVARGPGPRRARGRAG